MASQTLSARHPESSLAGLPIAQTPAHNPYKPAIRKDLRSFRSAGRQTPQSSALPLRCGANAAQSFQYSRLPSTAGGATRLLPASAPPARILPLAAKNSAALPAPAASPDLTNSPGSAMPAHPAAPSPDKFLPPPTN